MKKVKIVVFVPISHADILRDALGKSGTGEIGNYAFCSFSIKGTGRFLPNENANPTIGQKGQLEVVEEERIEVVCPVEKLELVIAEIKKVHPYEEPATEVYPLLDF